MRSRAAASLFALCMLNAALLAATPGEKQLIVVADLGGVSAIPYYHALNLLAASRTSSDSLPSPKVPASAPEESAFLPVHSAQLTPGDVTAHTIRAPGLTPFFLIGDDERSTRWLATRAKALRQLGAVGFIVHVDTEATLRQLRASAPGLTLVPASADDLARRLHLQHYPVLVTATGVEQ